MSCACINSTGLFDLAFTPGDTVSLVATVRDAAGALYAKLRGFDVIFRVVADDTATATVIWNLGPDDGAAILDAEAAQILLFPTAEQSALLETGKTYPARLILGGPFGEKQTLAVGVVSTTGPFPSL